MPAEETVSPPPAEARVRPVDWRDLADARRCEKLLWHRLHEPREIPRAPEMIFDQHPWIACLVLEAFPGGVPAGDGTPEGAHAAVRSWDGEKTLLGPMVGAGNQWARAAVLAPFRGGAELILASDAMNLRDSHLAEGAWVWRQFTGAGLVVKRLRMLLLDRTYLREGPVDPHQLFRGQDITAAVAARAREIPGLLRRLEFTRELASCPTVKTGSYCQHPIPCPLHERCHAKKPAHSVTKLVRGRRTAEDLMAKGIFTLDQVPDTWPLSETQAIQVKAVKTGAAQVDRTSIEQFLSEVKYPIHFLDFEACQTPVPFVSGTRPYEVVPMQYSVHIVSAPGAPAEARHFLAEYERDGHDPRPALLAALEKDLAGAATVGAFNAGFEMSRLKEMASTFPEHRPWISKLMPNFVDFWDPFRQFWWYHPDQDGRTGVKTLMPLMSGRRYEDLDIGDGHTASLAWLRIHVDPRGGAVEMDPGEREKVRSSLVEYCRMDTEALLAIHDFLTRLVDGTRADETKS